MHHYAVRLNNPRLYFSFANKTWVNPARTEIMLPMKQKIYFLDKQIENKLFRYLFLHSDGSFSAKIPTFHLASRTKQASSGSRNTKISSALSFCLLQLARHQSNRYESYFVLFFIVFDMVGWPRHKVSR